MKDRRFLDEAALGAAEAIRAAPWISAGALLVSACVFRDVRWSFGAMFLAGLALSRESGRRRWGAVALVVVTAAASAWFDDLHNDWLVGWQTFALLRITFSLAAAAWGMRSAPLAVSSALAFVAFNLATTPDVRGNHYGETTAVLAGASAVAAALVALGSRGHVRSAIALALGLHALPMVVKTIASGGAMESSCEGELVESATVSLFLCPIGAGLVARAERSGEVAPGTSRIVATAQRRPWLSSIAVALLAMFATSAVVHSLRSILTLGCVAGVVVTATIDLLSRSRAPLAPLAALVPPLAVVVASWDEGHTSELWLLFATAATLWLLLLGLVMRPVTSALARPRGLLIALLVVLAVVSGIDMAGSVGPWIALAWLTLLALSLQSAAAAEWPSSRIVAGGFGLGFVACLAGLAAEHLGAGSDHFYNYASWPIAAGVWIVAGYAVVLARRARSLTAIPDDHPVRADFDDRSPA